MTDGSYTICGAILFGEYSIIYGDVESLCHTPDTTVTLCVNHTQFFFKSKGKLFVS